MKYIWSLRKDHSDIGAYNFIFQQRLTEEKMYEFFIEYRNCMRNMEAKNYDIFYSIYQMIGAIFVVFILKEIKETHRISS